MKNQDIKRKLIFFKTTGLFFVLLLKLIQLSGFAQKSFTASFTDDYPEIILVTDEKGNSFEKVILKDLEQTHEVGKPNLPVKYISLLAPTGFEFDNIVIDYTEEEEILLTQDIYLTPPFDQINSHSLTQQEENYDLEAPWPEQKVKLIHQGYFDGSNRIITLAVFPIIYFQKQNKLTFTKVIKFTLNLKQSDSKGIEVFRRLKKNQDKYDKILESFVFNPEDIEMLQIKPKKIIKETDNNYRSIPYPEYVLITSEELKPAFEDFVNWKTRKGFDIQVVTLSQIYENFNQGDLVSGIRDNAGNIRQYLKVAYQNGTVWALLAGDYNVVPIRYGWGTSNTNDSAFIIPADLYFADFTGDWKVDRDHRYGEPPPDDAPDYQPEIFVGRLLCSSTQDINNWTRKVLQYEKNPGNGDNNYLIESFMIESDQLQGGNQAEQVASELPMFNHTIWRELPSHYAQLPTSPKAVNVIEEMNQLYGLHSWFGHGTPNAVNTMASGYDGTPKWRINTIDAIESPWEETENNDGLDNLTNSDYPAIVYSVSCDNCPFDDYLIETYQGRNLGEGFTVITENGGPAILCNTRNGWVSYSYLLYKEFADLLSNGTTYNLGIAELMSKNNYNSHYLNYSHNLVGCPETEIWTDVPEIFENVTIVDNGNSITVNTGVSGCLICVCSTDYGDSYYLAIDNVSSYTFYTSIRPVFITITKHNYIPYVVTFPPPDLLVRRASVNPNYINAGDTVNASCTVRNNSTTPTDSCIMKYYLSTDKYLDYGMDIELKSSIVPSLNGNESVQIYDTIPITPSKSSYEDWYVLFFVDACNYIVESNEENNLDYAHIYIDWGDKSGKSRNQETNSNNNFKGLIIENYLSNEKDYPKIKIEVYPNPVNEYLIIKTNNKGNYEIKIWNTAGIMVYSQLIKNSTSIDTQNFKKGIYFIDISDNNLKSFISRKKLIIL